jgi:hypothetical protein
LPDKVAIEIQARNSSQVLGAEWKLCHHLSFVARGYREQLDDDPACVRQATDELIASVAMSSA